MAIRLGRLCWYWSQQGRNKCANLKGPFSKEHAGGSAKLPSVAQSSSKTATGSRDLGTRESCKRGAANSTARQGEGEQSREWLKAAFSSWPSVTEQVLRNYNGSLGMKPFLGLDSSTGNTDVSRGSATVAVQHPFSQTLAFTGSRFPVVLKSRKSRLFLSLHNFPVTQT